MSEDKNNACGMHCPVSGINIPRFLAATVVGFAFVFGFDYIVHSILLMDTYTQTPELWRLQEEMQQYFPFMIGYQVLLVVLLGFIFTRNFEGKGVAEGVRFGLMMGALIGLLNAAAFIWMPISLTLALSWAGAGLGATLGIGIIFSVIYKK